LSAYELAVKRSEYLCLVRRTASTARPFLPRRETLVETFVVATACDLTRVVFDFAAARTRRACEDLARVALVEVWVVPAL
jgi:hypothetical protein